jgi:hypothetical protein
MNHNPPAMQTPETRHPHPHPKHPYIKLQNKNIKNADIPCPIRVGERLRTATKKLRKRTNKTPEKKENKNKWLRGLNLL